MEPLLINDNNLEFLYKLSMIRELCELLYD